MQSDTKSIFDAVADLDGPARLAYYDRNQIPVDLRAEVDSLLAYSPRATQFLASVMLHSTSEPATTRRFGPFAVRRILGQGGMGSVWLADRVDGEVDQTVAIKILHASLENPRMKERFLQERRILASLSHPNIAHMLDAGQTDEGNPYLVLEYVEGEPIDKYCETLPLRRKLDCFLKVCAAVSYAHRNLVVHRDLKPSNILVNRAGEPKLLDFGISKILSPDPDQTRTVDRMLTPDFASPEQVTGIDTGTASDIYSLGAILYKLLTGRSPHDFATATGIPDVICKQDATRPSRLNPDLAGDLDSILLKALRKDPAERYAGADKLAEDIEAHLQLRPVSARSGAMAYRTRRFIRRHWAPLAAAAIAIVGLAGGLVAAQRQRAAAEDARQVAEQQRQQAEGRRIEAQHERDIAAQQRAIAVAETGEARRERQEADRQRAIAQQRFQDIRQMALHLADFDSEIQGLDNATKARQALVSTSLGYLEKLRADANSGDPAFQLDLARAYARVADVQAGQGHPNLAQPAEAMENLGKAETLLLAVSRTDPRAFPVLAANLDTQARMAGGRRQWSDGAARASRGLDYARRAKSLALDDKERMNLLRAEASLEFSLQACYVNMERTSEAVTHGQRSASLRRQIADISHTPAAEIGFASATSAYATTLRYDGRLEQSLEQITIARAIHEKQYHDAPQRSAANGLQFTLLSEARLLGQTGGVSLGRLPEAAATYENFLNLSRERMRLDAQDWASRSLFAQGAEECAEIRLEQGDPAAALALFEEAYRVRSSLPAKDAARKERARPFAGSIVALARLSRHAEAASHLKELFEMVDNGSPIEPGSDRAAALRAQVETDASAGRLDAAIRTSTEMASAFASSTLKPDSDLQWALRNAQVYRSLAVLYVRSGDSASARLWRDKDRSLWVAWDHRLPGNAFVRNQLAISRQ